MPPHYILLILSYLELKVYLEREIEREERKIYLVKRLHLVKKSIPTDPPRILEPGKWGSKVRGLAHVQGYRGPQGYVGSKNKVPVPNLSTASRL